MSGNLIEMLNGRYLDEDARMFHILDELDRLRDKRTVDAIIADLAIFTDEQRSLAWSPEPPRESTGAADCRPGGSCGLDFNTETPHAQWVRARRRMKRELRRNHENPA
jgi:hypothetical protein